MAQQGGRLVEIASPIILSVRARYVLRSLEDAASPFVPASDVLPGGDTSLFHRHVTGTLPSASRVDGEPWELRLPIADALEALRLGVAVQLTARNAPREPSDAARAFQAVVLVATEREMATRDVWASALATTGAAGGQVLWTDAALTALSATRTAVFFEWEDRGGAPKIHECIYDNRLGLLDPPFERMFAAEIDQWIGPRRQTQNDRRYGRASLPSPTRPAVTNDLYGIALSGGGMRSATFSLGVLQALSENGLLEPADYLSTVSGGGYVGVSFSGLCAEELPYVGLNRLGSDADRFPFAVVRPAAAVAATDAGPAARIHGNETPALWHVRKYANLIAGGFGLLNLATWQLVGRYFVSTVALWLLFLVPLLGIAVVLIAGAWHWSWEALPEAVDAADREWLAPLLALSPLLVVLWVLLLRMLIALLPPAARSRAAFLAAAVLAATLGAAAVLVVEAMFLRTAVDMARPEVGVDADSLWVRRLLVTLAPSLVAGAFIALGFSTIAWDRRPLLGALAFLAVPFVATLLLYLRGGPIEWLWLSFGLALIAAGLVVATWARRAGAIWAPRILNAIASGAGAVLIAMLVGAGAWFFDASRAIFGAEGEAFRNVFRGWLAAGSAIASLMVGVGMPRMASGNRKGRIARALFGFGGYFILFSLAVFGAWVVWRTLDQNGSWMALPIAAAFAAILLFPLTLDLQRGVLLNVLSLSGVYEDRLQQTWIIGARPPRAEHAPQTVPQWHRVWTRPDLTVTALATSAEPAAPYPLICATLNIPGSRGDKLPERKSDSFVIAPVYSGSALSRWSPTDSMDGIGDMSLARAASISGAAVAPNMGEKTSGTLSILTTIFNVRIGRWVRNPRRPAARGALSRAVHSIPAVLYLRELLGNANREDDFIYLSDGGHFENLGVYELFRRRCRYIVAVSSDIESIEGTDALGNLGTALRMARVDFGVEVNIPSLKPLLRNPETGRVLSYFAVGKIRYGSVAGDGDVPPPEGTFVLIKTGLVEDSLTADLVQYLAGNPMFPYDSTLDQQFDQPQFESYRHLGYLAGQSVSRKASTWPEQAGPPPAGWPQPLAARFQALREEFDTAPSAQKEGRGANGRDDSALVPPTTAPTS